jgi:hypothetical protein
LILNVHVEVSALLLNPCIAENPGAGSSTSERKAPVSLYFFADYLACLPFFADFIHTALKISSDMKKYMPYVEMRIIL